MKPLTLICLLLSLVTFSGATSRRKHHHQYPRSPLATHEAQIEQNQVIERLHLSRIKDDKQLHAMVLSGDLVSIPETLALSIDPRLPKNRRYCRIWSLQLIQELARQYKERFGYPLMVTSAVRTVQVQIRLLRINHNAAKAHGEEASSHLTGATIDVSRKNMTKEENRWMEDALLLYSVEGRVIFIEEHGQLCFHVFCIPDLTLKETLGILK